LHRHRNFSEDIIASNPFDRVKIPRPPRKVIPAFSDSQINHLLNAINTRTTKGFRDYIIILTLLDTGLRVFELCKLELSNLWLDESMLKVVGKGNKERLSPIGKRVPRKIEDFSGCLKGVREINNPLNCAKMG